MRTIWSVNENWKTFFALQRFEPRSCRRTSQEKRTTNKVYSNTILKFIIFTKDRRNSRKSPSTSADNGSFVKAYSVHVELRSSTEYFLAGSIKKGEILLNQRSWIQPWKEVTSEQREGIERFYGRNCECHITPACFGATDCVQPLKGCQVSHDYHTMQQFYQGCEWRYSYCKKNREATACSWQETAEYRNCRDKVLPWKLTANRQIKD